MKMILVIVIILICSCKAHEGFQYDMPTYTNYASPFDLVENDKVHDGEIEDLVTEFELIARDLNYPLDGYSIYTKQMDLNSSTSHLLGQCQIYGNDRLVIVDTNFWAKASIDSKRALVFHELGHCYLNRGHRINYYQGPYAHYDRGLIPLWDYATHANWPLSLMHRSLISDVKFHQENDFYLRELFDERFINATQDSGNYNCTGEEDEF